MIEWVVSSCILILAVIALRYLLRGKISLRLQYALWLLVLARLLIPVSFGSTDISVMSVVEKAPAVQAVESVRDVDTIWQADNGSVQGLPAGAAADNAPLQIAPRTTSDDQFSRMSSALTLRKILLPVWWGGAAVTLLVFLTANLCFAARLRKSRRPLAVESASLPVYVARERAVPCLFGLFRPAIYVTQAAADDPELLRHTVAHETTHFRHGDHVWALLRTVCLALHWWNPLVWWAAKLSRQDGELACDEATIRALGESERAAYGRTLIRMACGPGSHVLLTATTMDGGKTSLHERIVLLAKKPRTAALAAIALVLAAALCVGCTFTGAKKNETLGPIAAMMKELTTDALSSECAYRYPDIDWAQMVAAMNDAAAYEVTEEDVKAAEQADFTEGENLHYMVEVYITDSHDLSLSCDTVPADFVCVTDTTALVSDAFPAQDTQTSAYFRDHDLYELLRSTQESGMTLRERMASVEPEDLGEISPYLYPQVTVQQLADALHMASSHKQITEAEAMAAGFSPMWRLQTDLNELVALCSSQEYIVSVQLGRGATGYFRDKTLYDLVRHSRDYDEFIDQASYEEFKPQIDAVMQQTLDNYATNPGKFTAYQLTRFTKVWQYATGDGNRADVYRFDYALMPEKPLEIGWAGGAYLDSQMRMQGFSDCGNVAARYRGDTLLGLVFMGNDNSYVPSFDEDRDWANGMLAAMEEAASAPTLTTETFSIHGLKVEVSNVCLTKKGTVREDASQVFENDVFVVYPGAVLTVLEAPTFRDTDGVEHGDFVYYSHGGAQQLELWSGMTVAVEDGSAIVNDSFSWLVLQLYSGM